MARPAPPERNRAARSFRQLRRFHHVINSDKVFGIHRLTKLAGGVYAYTPAFNSHELATVIEASILELYSSLDCTAKVLHAVYGHGSRAFPKSTRKLFCNYDKVTGSFPDELKEVFRTADWYDGLRYLRDELTHLATGSCSLDHKTGVVSYMHMGMKLRGQVYIIEDIFTWLAATSARFATCACRKSNPNIFVVQPAQDRAAKNGPGQLDGARDRRILLQR
jgi:hypothetical protein